MTKLNLSALKKKADILAHPPAETIVPFDQTDSAPAEVAQTAVLNTAATGDSLQGSSVAPIAAKDEQSPAIMLTPDETPAVKEFFPNLTMNDELFDDIFAKKETSDLGTVASIQEVAITQETTPISLVLPDAEIPTAHDIVVPSADTLVSEITIAETVAANTIDEVALNVSTWNDQSDRVQWVAEDLSLAREGGLNRLSAGKKTAIFTLAGLCIVGIIGGWLYTLGVFPPTKTSSIEAARSTIQTLPVIVVPTQTGAAISTGAILPVLPVTNTGSNSLSGSLTTSITLTGSTSSGSTLAGVVSTGSIVAWPSLSGSTLTGSTIAPSGSGQAQVTPTGNKPTTMSGPMTPIRTPNIRIPRIGTGSVR